MTLLFLEGILGYKHWEVAVRDAELLESRVKERLDLVPNEERARSEHITARYVIVIDQFSLGDDLLIPFGKVPFLAVLY